jgi:flagellar biosynthesis GTPase FlhF
MSKKCLIRAKTLELALKRARTEFGRDSMIVDTREVKAKDPEGMGIQSFVELTVIPRRTASRGPLDPQLEASSQVIEHVGSQSEYLQKLQKDIQRIEHLIRSITETEAKLKFFKEHFPIGEELLTSGVTHAGLRILQSTFEEKVPASERRNRTEALRHLAGYLHCTHARSFEEIAGPHLFLGAAGSGKTTLLIKLATMLANNGKTLAIVAAAPYHGGEVKRIEAAASALMCDAAVARDNAELERALEIYSNKDVVLVDTPCLMSQKRPAAALLFKYLEQRDDLYRHYVCSLTSDFDFLLSEIDLSRKWKSDYIALSKLDLAKRCGKIVDIALSRRITFSFVSFDHPSGIGIRIADPDVLIGLIAPSVGSTDKRKVQEGGGSR